MIVSLLVLVLPLSSLLVHFKLCFVNLKVLHEAVHFLNRVIVLLLLPVLSLFRCWLLLAAVDWLHICVLLAFLRGWRDSSSKNSLANLILLLRLQLRNFCLMSSWIWLLSNAFCPSLWLLKLLSWFSWFLYLLSFLLALQVNAKSLPACLGVWCLPNIRRLWLSIVFTKLLVIFETLFASVKRRLSLITAISAVITFVLLRFLLKILLAAFVEWPLSWPRGLLRLRFIVVLLSCSHLEVLWDVLFSRSSHLILRLTSPDISIAIGAFRSSANLIYDIHCQFQHILSDHIFILIVLTEFILLRSSSVIGVELFVVLREYLRVVFGWLRFLILLWQSFLTFLQDLIILALQLRQLILLLVNGSVIWFGFWQVVQLELLISLILKLVIAGWLFRRGQSSYWSSVTVVRLVEMFFILALQLG